MCEQFVAWSPEPFRIDELWPFTERLERFGIAGFGWGAGWLAGPGGLASHRIVHAFRDDAEGRERVGARETTALLVHLRRPSRLSTMEMPDAQPFEDPRGRYVYAHNGDLRDWRAWRARYRAQGRIHGRADTEVSARWLEDAWGSRRAAALLAELHETFGGQANLAVLEADGTLTARAGNTENPVFAFELGRITVVSTGIYSLDRSLFTYVAPGATSRRLVKVGMSITLR